MRPIPISLFYDYMWYGGSDWRTVKAKPIFLPLSSFFCITGTMDKARGGGVNVQIGLLVSTLKNACAEDGKPFAKDADIKGAEVEVCGRSVICLSSKFNWDWGLMLKTVPIQWKKIPIQGTKKNRIVGELRNKDHFSR